MVQTFLLQDTITNEKTVKFLQLDIFTRHLDLQVPIILTMHNLPLVYKLLIYTSCMRRDLLTWAVVLLTIATATTVSDQT